MKIEYKPAQLRQKQRANDKFFREVEHIRTELAVGNDTVQPIVNNSPGTFSTKVTRFFERVLDLADNGMMRDIDLDYFQLLKPYRVESAKKSGNIVMLKRNYPMDSSGDLLHENLIGANEGYCERAREFVSEEVQRLINRNDGGERDFIPVDEGGCLTDAEIKELQDSLEGEAEEDEVDDDLLLGWMRED